MLAVALAVIVATGVGVFCERTVAGARRASNLSLTLMLYAFVPFIAYVSFAHLDVSLGLGVGLALAYAGLAIAGTGAWGVGRFVMHLPRPALGAVVASVIIVNTGYLGLPVTVALFGPSHLVPAVAYDQVVSGPMFFIAGLVVGLGFGASAADVGRPRLGYVLRRNPQALAAIAGLIVPAELAPEALVQASHVLVLVLLPMGFYSVGVNLSAERRQEHARAGGAARSTCAAVAGAALRGHPGADGGRSRARGRRSRSATSCWPRCRAGSTR